MILEVIESISAGGGVAVVSGFVGNIMGFARGRAEKNIVGLFVTGQADALYCLCGHAMSFHRKGTGVCWHREILTKEMTKGLSVIESHDVMDHLTCRCQKFIGDPSKNPAPVTPRGELDL